MSKKTMIWLAIGAGLLFMLSKSKSTSSYTGPAGYPMQSGAGDDWWTNIYIPSF